jgi:sugar phosphate permease
LKNELVKYESEQTRHANSLHALKDKRVLLFALYYLPITLSIYGLNLWLPTMIKQFDGGSDLRVSFLSSVPYLFGIVGLLIIPRSDDRLNDRYGHLDFLYLVGAFAIFSSAWLTSPALQVVALSAVAFCLFTKTAVFWTVLGRLLKGSSAAAGIILIDSVGNLDDYLGPCDICLLKKYTDHMAAGLYFLSVVMVFGLIPTYFVYAKFEKNIQKEQTLANKRIKDIDYEYHSI